MCYQPTTKNRQVRALPYGNNHAKIREKAGKRLNRVIYDKKGAKTFGKAGCDFILSALTRIGLGLIFPTLGKISHS
jgi:hypothetical protein